MGNERGFSVITSRFDRRRSVGSINLNGTRQHRICKNSISGSDIGHGARVINAYGGNCFMNGTRDERIERRKVRVKAEHARKRKEQKYN